LLAAPVANGVEVSKRDHLVQRVRVWIAAAESLLEERMHSITASRNEANLRRALRLAIRSLVASGDTTTLEKIGGGHVTPAFYAIGGEDGYFGRLTTLRADPPCRPTSRLEAQTMPYCTG
jgi:hypothetical protein